VVVGGVKTTESPFSFCLQKTKGYLRAFIFWIIFDTRQEHSFNYRKPGVQNYDNPYLEESSNHTSVEKF